VLQSLKRVWKRFVFVSRAVLCVFTFFLPQPLSLVFPLSLSPPLFRVLALPPSLSLHTHTHTPTCSVFLFSLPLLSSLSARVHLCVHARAHSKHLPILTQQKRSASGKRAGGAALCVPTQMASLLLRVYPPAHTRTTPTHARSLHMARKHHKMSGPSTNPRHTWICLLDPAR